MYADLSTPAGRRTRRILQRLYDELCSTGHEVVLIPAPEPKHSGHMIRVLQSGNAAWYSKFCQQFVSIRGVGRKRYTRPRTYIRRDRVEAALKDIIETGSTRRTTDADRVLQFVEFEIDNLRHSRRRSRELRRDPAGMSGRLTVF